MATDVRLTRRAPRRSLLWLLLGMSVLAAAISIASCAASPAPEQARLGNVFFIGELVQIPVPGTGGEIAWRVLDFSGNERARGTTPVTGGRAVVEPGIDQPGYFEVAFAPASGGDEERRAFAILERPAPGAIAASSPFGVMTHFAQGWERDVLPLIAAAGIRHIRDEQYWSEVESAPGEFVFADKYTTYMAAAAAEGLEPLVVMSFENPLYDEGQTPYTDVGRTAYGRYGRAILDQYGAQIRALEIWNEYNGSFARGPASEDRAGYYTAMLKEAYRQIKQARPDVTVLGGAAVTVPLPWMEAIFQQGGLDAMDGVVVHPYRTRPEGVEREIGALRQLIESYNGGRPKPIWATEFGHYDNSEQGRRINASYLVRMSTLMLSAGVERLYWYLMRDYQTDGSNFASMGLLRDVDSPFGRYAPAPAYVAYATLIRQLRGATYVRREPTDPRTQVHLFEKAGEEIRVAWSTTGGPRLQLVAEGPLTYVDLMGRARSLQPSAGSVNVLLSETPIYVEGQVRELQEWRADALIADSDLDFSPQDHALGWQYGHYDGDGKGTGNGADPVGPYSDDDFELLSPASDQWGRFWGDATLGPIKIDGGGAHPGLADERPVWAVRRWISPVDGTVRIRGELELSSDEGDGTEARILKDGVPVYAQVLKPAAADEAIRYDVAVEVRRGSAIDFALTPGQDGNVDNDATNFSASITLPQIANSVRDFSLVQGGNGWLYGYDDGSGFAPFPSGEEWGHGPFGYLNISRSGAHPGQLDGRPVRAVRRWISTAEGRVRITGAVAVSQNAGDGVRANIVVDGEPLLELEVGGPEQPDQSSYDVSTTLHEGSVVDFALDPGPAANIDFDGTTFTARLQKL